jgi:23S rRNA (cytosine1962-C5)-methyltransferase
MTPATGNAPFKTMLRLRLSGAAETAIRAGHPWVFSDSLREQNREGRLGELAAIYDRKDRFLAIGLFDPGSQLRVRVLHAGNPVAIDAAWWRERLRQAITRRDGLFDERTTGYRWINGESDGWPGLVLDRYDTTLVVKLYTAVWLPRLEEVMGSIRCVLPALGRRERRASVKATDRKPAEGSGQRAVADGIVLRLSRNIERVSRTKFHLSDGQWLAGDGQDARIIFLESALCFEADVVRGQKTGFFLDQRENRSTVESFARDRDVLNAFSFTGGFSVYAARGGARSVTDLDISRYALAGSERNFALNSHVSKVASCRHELIQADAFEWIEQGPKRLFDFVIFDPPSLAKRESERSRAIHAYRKLASGGIRRLKRRGILAAASCSAHVSAEEFFAAVHEAAKASRREYAELRKTGHGTDHPATFPEAHYLKCIYLKF